LFAIRKYQLNKHKKKNFRIRMHPETKKRSLMKEGIFGGPEYLYSIT